VIRALRRGGFIEDRQKGSHLILIHPQTKARTVAPIHGALLSILLTALE
jgi:predicted RNA binding protein YcfA (HicA-like mRNA interferase family)